MTILRYAFETQPRPLKTGQDGGLTLVVSNPTDNYVTIVSIVVDLQQGSNATNLTEDPAGIVAGADMLGWSIERSGAKFTLTPNSSASGTLKPGQPGQIGGQGLVFRFTAIAVNAEAGTVSLAVTENLGSGKSTTATIDISKFPQDFDVGGFLADPPEIDPGGTTTLNWKGSLPATYTLVYNGRSTRVEAAGPFPVSGLTDTTTFTLRCQSSVAGHDLRIDLQATVQVKTAKVVSGSFQSAFDIVYKGQKNWLQWQTVMADACELKLGWALLDGHAPLNASPGTYPIQPSEREQDYKLTPIRHGTQGATVTVSVYVGSLGFRRIWPGRHGWTAAAADASISTSEDQRRVYLCNVHTNCVDVMSLKDGSITASIPVGLCPRGIALSADLATLYVANGYSNTVSVIDTASLKVSATIDKVPDPFGIALIGRTAYVANFSANSVSVLNLDRGLMDAEPLSVEARKPTGVAVSPDGGSLFVASYADGQLSVFDLAKREQRATVDVGPRPICAAVSMRDGSASSVYVAGHDASDIAVIETRTDLLTTRAPAFTKLWGLGASIDGTTVLAVGDLGVVVLELARPQAARSLLKK